MESPLGSPSFSGLSEPPDADKMPEIRPDSELVPSAGITHRVTSRQLAQTRPLSIRRRSSIGLLSSKLHYSLLGRTTTLRSWRLLGFIGANRKQSLSDGII